MFRCNYHTHTTYCDGRNTVEEMVRAALAQDFQALGFSGHGFTRYDDSYCMSREDEPRYVRDVAAARAEYAGQIEIYLGVEDDFHGQRPGFARDYTIGSVHTVLCGGVYTPVDYSRERLCEGARQFFGGDLYALCRSYFESVAQVKTVTACDIVGHFDLVSKFNEGACLFDEADPRYHGAAMAALEQLCRQGAVFEINTGAMWRGYRSAPYPNQALLRAIHAFGGAIVLSSDCHESTGLSHWLDQAALLARDCGFQSRRVLRGGRWCEIGL